MHQQNFERMLQIQVGRGQGPSPLLAYVGHQLHGWQSFTTSRGAATTADRGARCSHICSVFVPYSLQQIALAFHWDSHGCRELNCLSHCALGA